MDSLVLYCIFSINKLLSSKSNASGIKALETHNDHIKDYEMPSFTLNTDLSKISQMWAEELSKQEDMSNNYEETSKDVVYCGWTSMNPNTNHKLKYCVEKWKNKIKKPYDKNQDEVKCGNFSQIDWKDITEIGMGVSESKTGRINVVTNYYSHVPVNFGKDNQFNEYFHLNSKELSNMNNLTSVLRRKRQTNHMDIIRELRNYLKFSLKFSLADDVQDNKKTKQVSLASDEFTDDFMAAHNEYRMLHRAPLLILNPEISSYAQTWATYLAEENDGLIKHREQDEYGENIYFAWTPDMSFVLNGRIPVEKWYSEISNYTFGRDPDGESQSGHFTQLVWVATREVGVGVAKSLDGFTTMVVANYFPPGNIMGEFSSNVFPTERAFGGSFG